MGFLRLLFFVLARGRRACESQHALAGRYRSGRLVRSGKRQLTDVAGQRGGRRRRQRALEDLTERERKLLRRPRAGRLEPFCHPVHGAENDKDRKLGIAWHDAAVLDTLLDERPQRTFELVALPHELRAVARFKGL